MQARTERRAPDVARIPLDVLVRLTHEDYEDPFDADGVDVSEGGLSLRSDYLPEVGDRLRCRFDCPPEGEEIELDGEVVWAHDAGARSGEFGLRFAELEVHAGEALGRLIAGAGGSSPHEPMPMARLHLEAVATPIDAQIVARGEGSITVEQKLPFLRLGMSVVVEGADVPSQGRLAVVELRVEDGIPRLVLVVREARAPSGLERPLEDAIDAHTPAHESEPDATLEDYEPQSREASPDDVVEIEHGEVLPTSEHRTSEHRTSEQDDELDGGATGTSRAAQIAERLGPIARRAKDALAAAASKTRPALSAVWAMAVVFFAKVLETGGPRAKRAWTRTVALGAAAGAKIATRLGRGKVKRRTTAMPPRVTVGARKLRRQHEEPEAPPKKSRRVLLMSVLAFAGVGAAVYALSGGEQPSQAPVARAAAPPPVPAVLPAAAGEASPEPSVALSAALPAPSPELVEPGQGSEAPAEVAADPRATPELRAEAGRLGEPTFPSLREATQRPAPPGQSFGAADVPNGRAATIRLSQPATSLRGERQPDGFTVTIPGALALDRAGPIAAANPSVEQATILNRGDHAVLTVRFVAGRNPPYRVVARGQAIEITIGR